MTFTLLSNKALELIVAVAVVSCFWTPAFLRLCQLINFAVHMLVKNVWGGGPEL